MAKNYIVSEGDLEKVADAIREQSGKSELLSFPKEYVEEIENLCVIPKLLTKNDVTFYDYDGTIVDSYSATDFANLSAMPENPSHTGLTAQGWNWSLSNAKTYVSKYGYLDIGQMYITDDGKTRVYLHIEDDIRLSLYLALCPNGTVIVDWGDNTETDTLTGESLTTPNYVQHTYCSAGDYIMTLTVASGSFAFYSTFETASFLRFDTGTSSATGNRSRVYLNYIQKIEIGSDVSIGEYAFQYCSSLQSITMPNSITSVGNHAFGYCSPLQFITIPDGVASIGEYVFTNCYSLKSIAIPDGVTSIGQYTFQYCSTLKSIAIPDSVTGIGKNAFSYCYEPQSITIPDSVTNFGSGAFSYCLGLKSITIPYNVTRISQNVFAYCFGLKELHFIPTEPPTVDNRNAFGSLPDDCIIYVPSGYLSAYTGASNYPSSLIYTYVEE